MTIISRSIRDVIEDIQNNNILLPAFQREYVWKRADIVSLFDSLMRDYPINTMMFWNVDNANKLSLDIYKFIDGGHYKEGNTVNAFFDIASERRIILVIDGQQRLSSLLIGIYGSYTTEKGINPTYLYLNLDTPANAAANVANNTNESSLVNDEEDGAVNNNEVRNINLNLKYRFEFLTDANAKSLITKGEHWIKVRDVYDAKFNPAQYLAENKLADNDSASDALYKLYQIFKQQHLINYYEVRDNDLDHVLDIFVRTNQGGRKLTKGDLLMSVITATWTINQVGNNARKYIDGIIKDFDYKIEKDWVLSCILYLLDKSIKLSVDQFDNATSQTIYQHRVDLKQAIVAAGKLVRLFGLTEKGLTTKLALLPIAWHIYHFKLAGSINNYHNGQAPSINTGIRGDMRTWLFRAIVKGFFAYGTSEKLNKIRDIQTKHSKADYFPIKEIIEAYPELDVDNAFIDDLLQTAKKNAFPVLNIIYSQESYVKDHPNDKFEVDHVHPISSASGNTDFDLLPNLQLLTKVENNSKSATNLTTWWNGKVTAKETGKYLLRRNMNTAPAAFYTYFNDRKHWFAQILAEYLGATKSQYYRINAASLGR